MDRNAYFEAVLRLHRRILNDHWEEGFLVGPDPVGRIHWRITRFIRSYLPFLPGDDRYIYLQGLAYWIKSNLRLDELSEEDGFNQLALECADGILERQLEDGTWLHPPIPGRRDFISTVEGVWGSLGLLAAYSASGKRSYLEGALKWYSVQIEKIGFQEVGDGIAANYYAHSDLIIPNVSTMLLWLLGALWKMTGEERYLEHTHGLIRFIKGAQLSSGELPYEHLRRPHFMCFQYNAFEFLDLAEYFQITGDESVREILIRLGSYLSTGLTPMGGSRYNCHRDVPEVHYWTAALGAALRSASELNLGDYQALSEKAFDHVLAQQRADGSFDFSRRNYGILKDRRSYPRYLAMILWHLLYRVGVKMQVPQLDLVGKAV